MSLYTRARKHIDMNRVKELREEKIKREQIAEMLRQQEKIRAELEYIEAEESKYVNWRKELNEGMTTAGLGMINYPAVGDVDLAQFDYPVEVVGSSPDFSKSGNDYTFGPADAGIPPAETSSLTFEMNSEIYDTIVFDFVNSGVIDELLVVTGSDGGLSTYNISTSSGRKVVTLVPADRKKLVTVAWSIKRSAGGGLGTNKILNVAFQRRTPINLFVPLDDPEALSFIRGGLGGSEERRQRLKEQLDAGNELMIKLGLDPSKTSPGDIELAQALPYTDEDDAFDDPYYKGPPPDLDDDSDFDPDSFEYAGLRPDGTQGFNKPGDEVYDPATKKKYKLVPKKGYGYNQWIPIEKAGGGGTMVA